MELVNKALHQFETHVTTAEKYRNANAQWEKERKMEERERQKLQEEHEKLVKQKTNSITFDLICAQFNPNLVGRESR